MGKDPTQVADNQLGNIFKMAFLGIDGLVTVGYGMLYCFHTSFTAQLHMFPQNMYVLNRYANYPNGNQEA